MALSRLHRIQDDLELSDPEMIDLFATWLRETSINAFGRDAERVEREYLTLIGALINKFAGADKAVTLSWLDIANASEYITVRQDALLPEEGVTIYLSERPAKTVRDILSDTSQDGLDIGTESHVE